MVKNSTTKKRNGIGRGVQKHKLRVGKKGNSPDISDSRNAHLSRIAQLCWNYQIRACTALFLFPFEGREDGTWFSWGSPWRLLGHYMVLSTAALITAFRLFVTVQKAATDELDLTTYLCVCYVLISLTLFSAAMGSTWKGREMVLLHNSTRRVLDCFTEIAGGGEKRLKLWDSPSACFKLMCLTWVAQVTALNASAFSLVFESLPVCIFPYLRRLDVLPSDEVLPHIVWKLLLYPVEVMTLAPAMYLIIFNYSTIVITFRTLEASANVLRNIELQDEGQWEKVEKAYKYLNIVSGIMMNYMKYMIAPILFVGAAGTVVLLYVSLRPSGLHVLIYCWFPLAGASIMAVVLWICYDIVVVKRLADEVLGTLQDVKCRRFFRQLPNERQREMVRRGRALRPLSPRVGEFAEFSFTVTYNIWDEILNQLLLLLSL